MQKKSKGSWKRLLAVLLCLAMLLPLVLMMSTPVSAIGGTYYYKPAESNIAQKFWVSATASSSALTVDNAIDGDLDTAWIPNADGAASYTVDLGGAYDAVRRADIVFISPVTVYQYKLEGSTDGTTWTLLSDRSGNDRICEGFSDVFQLEGLCYLRYSFNSTASIGIKEIKVFNYWRAGLEGGADVSGFTSATNGIYFNSNNTPAAPAIVPDGQGGYRSIRGGVFNINNTDTLESGENFWGLTKDMGWDTIRLRIWNEHRSESVGGGVGGTRNRSTTPIPSVGTSRGPVETNNMAKYIVGAGHRLAIDFHYADNWADPQRQPKPYKWAELPFDDPEGPIEIPLYTVTPSQFDPDNPAHYETVTKGLVTTVYEYTKEIIEDLIIQGTPPGVVALGNEITNGMMWGSEFEVVQPFIQRNTDYFYRYIVGRGLDPQDANTTDPRGEAPRGGGIKWIAFEDALAAREAGDEELYEELYAEFLDSVMHLAKLVNAGQRAISELNEEYKDVLETPIETELHFAFNLFEGSPKQVIDPNFVTLKNMTLLRTLGEYLDALGLGMSDRIGLSQYPDWHGPYTYVQQKMVELSYMFPGVKINVSEVWHRNNLSVNSNDPTAGNAGWTQDPNVVRNPMNNDGYIIPDWWKNPNLVPNGNPWPTGWDPEATQLPTNFTQNKLWQGQDVINHMTYLNDVPNNVGQGVWQWAPNSRGYWENASGTNTNSPNSAGAQPSASFLSFTQGRAVNALEGAIYITVPVGAVPQLPDTVKNVDAKTGEVTEIPVNWPAISISQYSKAGTFKVRNVEEDGTTTAISGPYWNGELQQTYPIAGTMREVTAYITVIDYHVTDQSALKQSIDYGLAQMALPSYKNVVASVRASFEAALENAIAVHSNLMASQSEVSAVWTNLLKWTHALDMVEGDKVLLLEAITAADSIYLKDYVARGQARFINALAYAKEVYENAIISQLEIDEAMSELISAMLALRFKADTSILNELLASARTIKTSRYTTSSILALTKAIESAEMIIGQDLSESDQQLIDSAVAALQAAIDGLAYIKLFSDVSPDDWFFEYVMTANEAGLMIGFGDGIFAPNSELSRAQVVQVLYNMEDGPSVKDNSSVFDDVSKDHWALNAVLWATKAGIIKGYGDDTFGPNDIIKRQDFASILHRYSEYKGYDTAVPTDFKLAKYTDASEISDYASETMRWAVYTELISGRTNSTLVPLGSTTRAECATLLSRFMENILP